MGKTVAKSVIVDTGAFLAILYAKDKRHLSAGAALKYLALNNFNVFTTNFIMAETYALINSRLGSHYARIWLKNLVWLIERVTEQDEIRAREVLLAHTDKDYSYTDAASFALMERMGVDTAFTFDRHFAQFGFNIIPVIKIL